MNNSLVQTLSINRHGGRRTSCGVPPPFIFLLFLLLSCSENGGDADAYGNFEVRETLVSAEVSGRVIAKNYEEGDLLTTKDVVVVIDTTQLALQKRELEAKKKAIEARKVHIRSQIKVQQQQKTNLEKEAERFRAMLQDSAATPKQVDDIEGNLAVINDQISSTSTSLLSVDAEMSAIEANIAKINDMISRSVVAPGKAGTLLEFYVEAGEMAVQGKPLFKMADLENMELKAYISGKQLSQVQLGQQVKVRIDGKEGMIEFPGKITWIASEAEFTPKNIQTREERIHQVYAMKVHVENMDGTVKINMPGEVYFNKKTITQ